MKRKRILLLLTSGLGNCVQATPAILELRRLLPEYIITLFGPQKNLDLLNAPAFADEFVNLPTGQSLMRFLFTHPKYLFRRYEYVFSFCCCNPGKLYLLKQIGLIHHIFAVRDRANSEYRFDYALDAVPEYHEAQMGLDLLKMAGFEPKTVPTNLYLSKEEKEFGRAYFVNRGCIDGQPVIIHPFWTAIGKNKSIRPNDVSALMNRLKEDGIPCFLLLGPEEFRFYKGLAEFPIRENQVVAENITTRKLAAILSAARACISADSGPAHIASAVGVQVFEIFAASVPERAKAFGPKDTVCIGPIETECRNCYERNFTMEPCSKGRPCYPPLSIEKIISALHHSEQQERKDD